MSTSTPTLTSWIDGTPHDHDGERIDVVNPTDEAVVARVVCASHDVVDLAVQSAHRAQAAWASRTPEERAAVLEAVAATVRRHADDLARADARETGKSHHVAMAEMVGVARYFEYYAAELKTLTGYTIESGPGQHTYVQRVPYGVVGVVVPWNYAANQATRSAAPALATGNAVVVKPSELASSAVLAVARLATEAGLPHGLLNVVTGDGEHVGEALVTHPDVRRISFTGSVPTGRCIAAHAARRLVPVGLELGGKSPHVVFADADLDAAARAVVDGITTFAGQTCSAGTRLLVEASVADALVSEVGRLLEGLDLARDVGPVITGAQRASIASAIARAVGEGARCAFGGAVADAPGFYVLPTVLTEVTPEMAVFGEEVFGPVLTVTVFEDEADAVALANATAYGLVAAVWTESLSKALRVSSLLECGQVFVNRWGADERVPFGGFGASGLGREKGSVALDEYTRPRAVVIEIS
jgi:aldehyde dehydrogenase (NAD+)